MQPLRAPLLGARYARLPWQQAGMVVSGCRSSSSSSRNLQRYNDQFRQSIAQREEFWAEQAAKLCWAKKWDSVLEPGDDGDWRTAKWFVGGQLNTSYNCLDRHVEAGHGQQLAVIHDSPVTRSCHQLTYSQLLDQVSRLAGCLHNLGVCSGDRVLIYMPMIPEAMIGMLAASRIGAVHSLVFGGFAAKELAVRIAHAQPKVILCGSCGVEPGRTIDYRAIVAEALELCPGQQLLKCIVYQREGLPQADLDPDLDLEWNEALGSCKPAEPVPVDANQPAYLLYTSGTTGSPKGIVRPTGGHAVALNYTMSALYDIRPGEVWWAASDFGWVVGHSYICYAPLLNRNTTVVYEGKPVGTPNASQYHRVMQQHKVAGMFTAPTALRALRRVDPQGDECNKYRPLPALRSVFVAGEHCDVETLVWARRYFEVSVYDHWWQTETGWAITSSCLGLGDTQEPPLGSAGRPVPGYDVQVLMINTGEFKDKHEEAEEHHEDHHGLTDHHERQLGRILVRLPMPPGFTTTLWADPDKYLDSYFAKYPGYYDTADAGYTDEEGHLYVVSRVDDVINVAGHRLSTSAMEEACLENPDLAECAVVPYPDRLKGHVPLGILVPYETVRKGHRQVVSDTVNTVREQVGPVAAFKMAVVVPKLPKTRSGKVARATLAAMAAGKPFKMPVTIEDDTVYVAIKEAMLDIGLNPTDPTH